MKNASLILVIIHFFDQLNSQNIKVDFHNKVPYPGFENNMTVVADGVECNHLYVKTDNGIIIPENNDCRFRYVPKKVGDGYFLIYSIEHNDTVLLEKHRVRVYPWQWQPATFANMMSGEITRGVFFAHGAVISRIAGFDIAGTNEIISYEIKLVRSKEIFMQLKNTGGRLEQDNLLKLEVIKNNDEVFFEKILAKIPGEDIPRELNIIKIKIVNRE
jgi:hypothetical protein